MHMHRLRPSRRSTPASLSWPVVTPHSGRRTYVFPNKWQISGKRPEVAKRKTASGFLGQKQLAPLGNGGVPRCRPSARGRMRTTFSIIADRSVSQTARTSRGLITACRQKKQCKIEIAAWSFYHVAIVNARGANH